MQFFVLFIIGKFTKSVTYNIQTHIINYSPHSRKGNKGNRQSDLKSLRWKPQLYAQIKRGNVIIRISLKSHAKLR